MPKRIQPTEVRARNNCATTFAIAIWNRDLIYPRIFILHYCFSSKGNARMAWYQYLRTEVLDKSEASGYIDSSNGTSSLILAFLWCSRRFRVSVSSSRWWVITGHFGYKISTERFIGLRSGKQYHQVCQDNQALITTLSLRLPASSSRKPTLFDKKSKTRYYSWYQYRVVKDRTSVVIVGKAVENASWEIYK